MSDPRLRAAFRYLLELYGGWIIVVFFMMVPLVVLASGLVILLGSLVEWLIGQDIFVDLVKLGDAAFVVVFLIPSGLLIFGPVRRLVRTMGRGAGKGIVD